MASRLALGGRESVLVRGRLLAETNQCALYTGLEVVQIGGQFASIRISARLQSNDPKFEILQVIRKRSHLLAEFPDSLAHVLEMRLSREDPFGKLPRPVEYPHLSDSVRRGDPPE